MTAFTGIIIIIIIIILSKCEFILLLLTGNNKMVEEKTVEVAQILSECKETTSEECNKETGERGSLNMKSRGYLFIVTAGGFIEMFNPIYKWVRYHSQVLYFEHTSLHFNYVMTSLVWTQDFG